MKQDRNKIFKLFLLFPLLATSCGNKNTVLDQNELKDSSPKFIYQEVCDFSEDTSLALQKSDARGNGDPFGVIWSANNVVFDTEASTMDLKITKEGDTYYGGEVRTMGDYGTIQYGYFATEMKPCAVEGSASTFFTYTGESEGNPHDEIDIEFLGKDTTKVQFNYFVNDVGGHEYWYDLGFDASKEFHKYGFYWDESRIIWYVDDVPVYGVNGEVPSHPQRVFSNFWAGEKSNKGVMDWMGKLNDSALPISTSYRSWSVSYLNGYGLEIPEPEYVPDYSEFTASPIAFNQGAKDLYTVVTNDDKTENRITYSQVTSKSYKNIYGAVESAVNSGEYVAMKIKNNSTDDYAKVRIDVQSDKANAAGIKAINEKAWQDGDIVKTDLTYGGSYFDIEPGQESVCIVKFYGDIVNVLLMIDSCSRTDKEFYAGDITISGFGYFGENHYVYEWVKLDVNSLVMRPGETHQLVVDASSDEVKYTVDNPNIATVSNEGVITAKGEGETTITVTSGLAKSSVTVRVTTKEPKEEETLPIINDADDLADADRIYWSNGTAVNTTENTYNDSKKALQVTEVGSAQSVMFSISRPNKVKVPSSGYITFYAKNMNHIPSGSGEVKNGFYVSLYDSTTKAKVGEEFKLYKSYNADCVTDAGNGWNYYKIFLQNLADVGSEFDCFKVKMYQAMSSGEVFYFDGLSVSGISAGTSTGGDENTSEPETSEPVGIDHSSETLPIASDEDDLLKDATKHWINGSSRWDSENHYGTSSKALAWSGFAANDTNMMYYLNADKTTGTTITANGYVEFFIKDVGHTSSTQDRASGVYAYVYAPDGTTKLNTSAVKAYKDYNNEYRVDAGNGWSRYQLPLTLFGELGAEFTQIRFSTNAACDAGEVLYMDGLRIVQP